MYSTHTLLQIQNNMQQKQQEQKQKNFKQHLTFALFSHDLFCFIKLDNKQW